MEVIKPDQKTVGMITLLLVGLSIESGKGSNQKNLPLICLDTGCLNKDWRRRKMAKPEFCLSGDNTIESLF